MLLSFRSLLLLLLFTTVLSKATVAAQAADQPISAEAFQEDLQLLKQALFDLHGEPFAYHSQEAFTAWFKEQAAKGKEPLSTLDAYRIIGQLNPLIGDSHTEIRLPGSFYEAIDTEYLMFPFGVRYLRDSLFLTVNLSGEERAIPGSVIQRINGKDANELFLLIRQYFERDGVNETGPNIQASSLFMDYYALLIDQPSAFTVDFLSPTGKEYTLEVPSQKWPVLEKRLEAHWEEKLPKTGPKQPLAFEMKGDIGYLKVRTFDPGRIHRAKQQPAQFFKAAFEKLTAAGAQELIIDVRNNGGGNEEVFIPLLQHLLAAPFQVYRELSIKTLEIPLKEHFPYDKPKKLEKAAKKAYAAVEGRFHDLKSPAVQMTAPALPQFKGKVFVLMNERSYSATGDFIGVLDQYDRATFVGVETGGNPYQNVAGERITLLLPNTKLRIGIPLLKYVINNDHKNEGRGMLPDLPIPQTVGEIIHFQDFQLEKLLQHIRP